MEGVEFGIVTEIDDEEKVTENEMKSGFVRNEVRICNSHFLGTV